MKPLALMLLLATGCMFPGGRFDPYDVDLDFDDWETARSQHFVVHTDAGRGAIANTIRRFEDTYEALKATFFEQVEVRQVEALVFGDETEYDAVAGRGSSGKFLPGVGPTGSLLVVQHSWDIEALDTVVAHELAHRFVDAAHPALPNWLDEGIASYLESVDVRGDEVRFGLAARRSVHHAFAVAGGVSFSALANVTVDRLYGNEASFYYSAAWALVHYLMNGRGGHLRPRFGELLVAVEDATRRRQSAEAAFAAVYPDVTVAELDEAIARLTRSLSRPSLDAVLSMPFRRPPEPAVERRPADPEQVGALVTAARRRNRPRVEPTLDLSERPRVVRVDAQPSGEGLAYLGLAYGHMFRAPFAWEASLGRGPLGYQLAGLVRGHLNVGEGGNFFVTAGFGPMLAVKSSTLGNDIPRIVGAVNSERRLYYFFGAHPELGAEVRTPSNVVVRASVGGYFRLADNFTDLCAPPLPPGQEPRCPSGADETRISRAGRELFARLGLGYSW